MGVCANFVCWESINKKQILTAFKIKYVRKKKLQEILSPPTTKLYHYLLTKIFYKSFISLCSSLSRRGILPLHSLVTKTFEKVFFQVYKFTCIHSSIYLGRNLNFMLHLIKLCVRVKDTTSEIEEWAICWSTADKPYSRLRARSR